MSVFIARHIMALAEHSLHDGRPEWAAAMRVEFDEAIVNGTGFTFALGCLRAAWQELPFYGDGRLRLASYALALGLIAPLAMVNIACSLPGFNFMAQGHDHYYATLASGSLQDRELASAYKAAVPVMTALIVLLGLLHLMIAWTILQRRFLRLAVLWPATALVALVLLGFAIRLFPSATSVAMTVFVALAAELATVPFLIWWQKRISRTLTTDL